MLTYERERYREHPLVVDQAERHRAILGFRGPHARAATASPGVGLRAIPVPRKPVNLAEPVDATGALARRTGLFVVAYLPLAAMFVGAKWPAGWSTPDLLLLGLWVSALAGFLAFPLASSFVPRGRPRRALAWASLLAGAVAGLGAVLGWNAGAHAPGASAVAAEVAFGLCVAAVEIVVLMVLTARRPSTTSWRVMRPGEPGGAVADYIGSYIFPLWVLCFGSTDSWMGYALPIYLFVVYLAFVRSHRLVLVNPLLNLLGFRLYDVFLNAQGGPRHVLLISRHALTPETRMRAVPLGIDCYVGRRPTPQLG